MDSDSDDQEEILLRMIIGWRHLISSSNRRRNTLLEASTLLLTNDEANKESNHGGSQPGKAPNVPRDFEGSYEQIFSHYFAEVPLYNDATFRRRFRMHRPLFLRIANNIQESNRYFTHRSDALGRRGIHPLVKITAALRMLAYGGAADCNDEYLQVSESTL